MALSPSSSGSAERYALMWSGGKDSALALMRARASGLRVSRLLNFYDPATDRVRFHATRSDLIRAQADAIGIDLRQLGPPWERYEATFRDLLAELKREGFAGIVFGDIHLADVRGWYEERVRAAGLAHVEPIWSEAPAALVAEFVASGSRAVITCCELPKLDEAWLGRIIDERFVDEIGGTGIDPAGENGEYHSFTFAGPLFQAPVRWRAGVRRHEGAFVQLDLTLSPGG
ncbi:MAG TPA: diphthine--ammonia ligase [Candidatus Limnocylindria bacterium]|nr:diphthine--ammonia ligase [Candidatus Limnocylindria bacterium]